MSEFLNVRMSPIHPRCLCFVWTLKMAVCSHPLKPTSHLLISPRMVPLVFPKYGDICTSQSRSEGSVCYQRCPFSTPRVPQAKPKWFLVEFQLMTSEEKPPGCSQPQSQQAHGDASESPETQMVAERHQLPLSDQLGTQ